MLQFIEQYKKQYTLLIPCLDAPGRLSESISENEKPTDVPRDEMDTIESMDQNVANAAWKAINRAVMRNDYDNQTDNKRGINMPNNISKGFPWLNNSRNNIENPQDLANKLNDIWHSDMYNELLNISSKVSISWDRRFNEIKIEWNTVMKNNVLNHQWYNNYTKS